MRGAIVAAALGSCHNMAFEGRLVDATGAGIPSARVALGPAKCAGSTDASGAFSVHCAPGHYAATIEADGFIADGLDLDAAEPKVYDVGKRVLVRVPEERGFLAFDANGYHAMKPARLERRTGGSTLEPWRAYCLAPKLSEANQRPPGVYPFLDHGSSGWRAFRLDDEGCAYRMSPTSPGQWGVDYAVAPQLEVKQATPDAAIVTMHLEPGSYFVADWQAGFFTPASDDPLHYTGYWIEVGG